MSKSSRENRDDEHRDGTKAVSPKPADRAALCGAGLARIWRRLCHHHPAGLYDRARLRRVAVGLVATASLLGTALLTLIVGWIAPRHDLRALLMFGAGLMAATGFVFPSVEHFVLIALVAFIGTINPSGGDLGVLVPLEHAVLARQARGREAHAGVCALQPDRRALHRGRLACCVLPDLLVAAGSTQLGAFRLMFFAYAALGIAERRTLSPRPACAGRRTRASCAARALARHRLQARGAVQHRCLRRRVRRPVAAGALAVRALRPVAVGGRPVLLLVEHAERVFLSGRGLARQAHRPRQHHGVHAHSVQRVPDPGGVLAQPRCGARTAAGALGAVANGRADPHLLRHGRGHAGRAARRRQRHRRAAQPRVGDQPGDRGRASDASPAMLTVPEFFIVSL